MASVRKYPAPPVGEKYGKWTVVSAVENTRGYTKIPCRCSCGNTGMPRLNSLVGGRTTGCQQCHLRKIHVMSRICWSKYKFIPAEHRNRLRTRINAVIGRCYSPKHRCYKNYGGRGISVFPAWRNDRTLFARYLMTLSGWNNPDLTIDRIDNDGDYEPGNLHFVTPIENNRNRPQYHGYRK